MLCCNCKVLGPGFRGQLKEKYIRLFAGWGATWNIAQFMTQCVDVEPERHKKTKLLTLADRAARWIVATIFVIAAVPKLLNISDFASIIDAYGILPGVALVPAAIFFPVLELILAAGLVVNNRLSKYLTIVLLLFFIGILSYAISQGFDIDCGCFGPEDPEHRAFQSLRISIVRDVLMILPLLFSLWYQRSIGSEKLPSGERK